MHVVAFAGIDDHVAGCQCHCHRFFYHDMDAALGDLGCERVVKGIAGDNTDRSQVFMFVQHFIEAQVIGYAILRPVLSGKLFVHVTQSDPLDFAMFC